MKPETLEAIKADAEDYVISQQYCSAGSREDAISRDGFIKGATKYAALLEQEREKSEKLVECLERALVDLQKNIIPLMDSLALHPPTLMEKDIEKALNEYKTTSK